MLNLLNNFITISYLGLFLYTISYSYYKFTNYILTNISAIIIIIFHGFILYKQIDTNIGHNISILNMLSLTLWLMFIISIIIAIIFKDQQLLILILPLCAISIFTANYFPGNNYLLVIVYPYLIHILLAISSISILLTAGLYSILVYTQKSLLKRNPNSWFLNNMQPLQRNERILLYIVIVGFLLLTITLSTAFILLSNFYVVNIFKIIFSSIAWILFAVLLYGQLTKKWHGAQTLYWSIAGSTSLAIAYFGTKLI